MTNVEVCGYVAAVVWLVVGTAALHLGRHYREESEG